MSLADRWTHTLNALDAQGCRRAISLPEGIDLCSNDYLGYAEAGCPVKPQLEQEYDMCRWRSGTAARLLRGHHPIWDEVESTLAHWHGAAAALVMTSGYAANEGLLSTVIQREDWVASDQLNHASIIDGLRLSRAERFIYRHVDVNHLEDGLRHAAAGRSNSRQLFIVTESLFGMDGDIAPLAEIVALAERYGANVIVDEAHSTGCYHGTGSGLVDAMNLRQGVLATMHTGGKALAVTGAYICGSELLRSLLINQCRHFMFSTALPPTIGYWWRDTIARIRPDSVARNSLHSAARLFRDELARLGVHAIGTEYIVPIVVGDDRKALLASDQLRAHGWDIRAIRSPTVPTGTARLRVSIHANHSATLLAQVASGLASVIKSLPNE